MCGPPYSCCHYSPLINDVISQIRAERTEEWPVTLIRFMLISPMWDYGPHRDTQFSLLTFLWWWWVSVLNLIMLHLKYISDYGLYYVPSQPFDEEVERRGETEMTFLSPVWCHLRGDGRMLVTDVWPTWGCLPLNQIRRGSLLIISADTVIVSPLLSANCSLQCKNKVQKERPKQIESL